MAESNVGLQGWRRVRDEKRKRAVTMLVARDRVHDEGVDVCGGGDEQWQSSR